MAKDPFSLPGSELLHGGGENMPSSHDKVFVKPSGKNGGSAGRTGSKILAEDAAAKEAEAESEVYFQSQDKVKDPEEEPKPVVKLSNPKWSADKGNFDGKMSASVEGELPPESAHLTRVDFVLFAVNPGGGKERIGAKDGHLKEGKAEAEFTLYRPQFRESGNLPARSTYIFSAKHRDSQEVQSPGLEVTAVVCTDMPDPVAPGELGKCAFYIWRFDNYVLRHKGCARKPPDYYMNYGHKYCVRFGTETAPKLSAVGKAWLNKARLYLQQRMEKELKNQVDIELNSSKFTQMAFGTHSDAYWDAGLGRLPITDLIIIGFTPDIKEWLDGGTRAQAYDISGRLVEAWGKDIQTATQKRAQEISEYFSNLFQ